MVAPLILVGAGVGAVVLVEHAEPPAPKPTTKAADGGTPMQGAGNATPGSSVQVQQRLIMSVGRNRPQLGQSQVTDPVYTATQPSTNSAQPSQPDLNGKLAQIEASAKKAYENLSSDAKSAGAAALNSQLNLDPPLTGNEDWDTVGSVVGGATGAAAGAAIGGPIGAKLGAIVGAYLGTQIADLLAKNWDELNSWLSSKWDDVQQYVTNAAQDAYDQAASAVDDAYNYVGGLF